MLLLFLILPRLFLTSICFLSVAFPINYGFSIYVSFFFFFKFLFAMETNFSWPLIFQDLFKKQFHLLQRPPFENLFFSRKSCLGVFCFEVTFSVFSHLSLLAFCIGIIFINYVLKVHLVSYF